MGCIVLVNSNNQLPLYKQILQDLRAKLREERWKTGDLFPSENELIDQYNVSSITIRRVILELVNEGWLERRPGIGTFVMKNYVEPLEQLSSFYEQVKAKGRVPSSKIIVYELVPLDSDLLLQYPKLDVFDGKYVYMMEKVNFMDNVAVEYHRSFWPLEIGKVLEKYDLSHHGTHDILQKELGIVLEQVEQEIKAALPEEGVARELGIAANVPVLNMERLAYAEQWRVVEFGVTTLHPDRYRCSIKSYRAGHEVENEIVLDHEF